MCVNMSLTSVTPRSSSGVVVPSVESRLICRTRMAGGAAVSIIRPDCQSATPLLTDRGRSPGAARGNYSMLVKREARMLILGSHKA